MLRNYFIAATRNLLRNSAYAAINLCGLALGFMAAILIVLFVRDEYSYDRNFPDHQHIYRVFETIRFPNRSSMYSSLVSANLASALKREFPEVQIAARVTQTQAVLSKGDVQSRVPVLWAEPEFFVLFPFKTLSGNLAQALNRPDSVVLTRATARQFFGRDDVTGEALELAYRSQSTRDLGLIQRSPGRTEANDSIFNLKRGRPTDEPHHIHRVSRRKLEVICKVCRDLRQAVAEHSVRSGFCSITLALK